MPNPARKSPVDDNESAQNKGANVVGPAAGGSPLSLNRLRAAFAQMLGADAEPAASDNNEAPSPKHDSKKPHRDESQPTSSSDPCEISPRTVVEAMLFVGRADDRPISPRELAAAMRGVSPTEIETAIAELNQIYERDGAPYHITSASEGYRLTLREEFTRMRDKLHGRLREAKLSPTAVEVLSIVAYHQPTTAEAINALRAAPSNAALTWLVRRKLVRMDQPADRRGKPSYRTTDRFLRLFGLESLAALPRSEELDKI